MVKSKFVELGLNDTKARKHILESLSACDWHILSRKLLERFSAASGPMFAIIGDWFDLNQMTTYDYPALPGSRKCVLTQCYPFSRGTISFSRAPSRS
jgi:hypothetical protein